MSAEIGVIGLAVMGQNLILNMNDHGFKVVAYNRTVEKVKHFMENEAKGTQVIGAESLSQFVDQLKTPKRILLMVKAGPPVDEFIEHLIPLLNKGDIIIDGGNSHYLDTKRRCEWMESIGLHFVGCGVSGGEEGARRGPSLMPGGSSEAWPHLKVIFQSIAAKYKDLPCCEWVGPSGSGHFVKMVHNGIEYGDMQLIAEAYHIGKLALGLTLQELAKVFEKWNQPGSLLQSFLMEISADILTYLDTDGTPLVEKIRDTAGQKGTGKWSVIAALDHGTPTTLVAQAVFARALSSLKEERIMASEILPRVENPPPNGYGSDKNQSTQYLYQALLCSKIISYAQGFQLLRQASHEHEWNLNLASITQMWQGGCIIRSVLLDSIKDALSKSDSLIPLLLDPFFTTVLSESHIGWRHIIANSVLIGIPVPAFSAALAYYDSIRCRKLPANLIQAQRDYFGAHTFSLEDTPDVSLHVNWTGRGGSISSSNYLA